MVVKQDCFVLSAWYGQDTVAQSPLHSRDAGGDVAISWLRTPKPAPPCAIDVVVRKTRQQSAATRRMIALFWSTLSVLVHYCVPDAVACVCNPSGGLLRDRCSPVRPSVRHVDDSSAPSSESAAASARRGGCRGR